MNYPEPADNPHCVCTNHMSSFFCRCGHMTECHWPYTCREAACSHLASYGFSAEDIAELEMIARAKMASGEMPEYQADEHGNVIAVGDFDDGSVLMECDGCNGIFNAATAFADDRVGAVLCPRCAAIQSGGKLP